MKPTLTLLTALLLAPLGASHAADTASAPAVLHCDLAVIGGGSGGFGAALAAARRGLDVVLVERADRLGGNSVRGGVHCWENGAGGTGIPFDLYGRLRQIPGAVAIHSYGRHCLWFKPDKEPYRFPGGETVLDSRRCYPDTLRRHGTRGMHADEAACREQWHGVVFEPDVMAATMKAMLDETRRCRVLLNTAFQTVQAAAGRVEFLQLDDGRRIVARNYVDATGDGWLCLGARCEVMTGQEARDRFDEPSAPAQASQNVNGVTLIYRVTLKPNPSIEPLPANVPAQCWWRDSFPVAQMNHYPNGDLNINMLPTMDGQEFMQRDYQAADTECRRRVLAHWHDLQTRYDEFRRYRIAWLAPALGVRETRRIVGEYVLTEDDVRGGLSRQTHPDMIAIADHALDTHGSQAHGIGELREPYGVPYRCLIPKGYRNLLIACRAASFSSLAASSCRLSRTMMQLGQAAGTAAALAKELNVDLPDVPPDRLRAALREQHVQLEHPMPESLLELVNAETASLAVAASAFVAAQAAASEPKCPSDDPPAIRLFNCDFNWARWPPSESLPHGNVRPSQPEDWAEVDAQQYFDWHREFGNNVVYCQAYCSSGFALYPSKLGPVGKSKAARLFPELYALARKAKLPVWSYYCVAADLFQSREHPEWLVPGSVPGSYGHGGFFGPETPHTELVCARLREFLRDYPVDWLLLDWFVYGSLKPDEALVQPAEFVKQPFQEIIGRPLPATAADITPAEHLKYKRVVLERQFRALQQAVRQSSPHTKIIFNVPFHEADEALWRDHPMLAESDGLFAESSDEVVGWLLRVRKPEQRVMTTIIGRGKGVTDPGSWRKWYDQGCDFFGYAWGTPPSFLPTAMYDEELKVVKAAFAEIEKLDAERARNVR